MNTSTKSTVFSQSKTEGFFTKTKNKIKELYEISKTWIKDKINWLKDKFNKLFNRNKKPSY